MDHRAKDLLLNMYERMREALGNRNWWPADSPFEVCVGAVLTQNTSWRNVAKAIANLKHVGVLDPSAMYESSHEELAALIKSAGYFNVKASRLRNFVNHLVERHEGSLSSLFSSDIEPLREELLSIKGIGKETADSMILYAAYKPIFVVDAYTKRILKRHGFLPEDSEEYDSIQEFFHSRLPEDTDLYNDFHAQFVAVGHSYCKRAPLCGQCPLEMFLPEEGPLLF